MPVLTILLNKIISLYCCCCWFWYFVYLINQCTKYRRQWYEIKNNWKMGIPQTESAIHKRARLTVFVSKFLLKFQMTKELENWEVDYLETKSACSNSCMRLLSWMWRQYYWLFNLKLYDVILYVYGSCSKIWNIIILCCAYSFQYQFLGCLFPLMFCSQCSVLIFCLLSLVYHFAATAC